MSWSNFLVSIGTPTKPESCFSIPFFISGDGCSMELADIPQTVPLQQYSTLDYSKADAIIKAGYDAAAAKASVLAVYSVSPAEWEQYLAVRNARRKSVPTPTHTFLEMSSSRTHGEDEIVAFRRFSRGSLRLCARVGQSFYRLRSQVANGNHRKKTTCVSVGLGCFWARSHWVMPSSIAC
jgi:hypothetical protein